MDISKELTGLFIMIFILVLVFVIFTIDGKKQEKKKQKKVKEDTTPVITQSVPEPSSKMESKESNPVNYGNYLYDRYNSENDKIKEINEVKPESQIASDNRYYGEVLNYNPVEIAQILTQLENEDISVKTKSLAEEFNGLSKEMKVYIIGKMLNKF